MNNKTIFLFSFLALAVDRLTKVFFLQRPSLDSGRLFFGWRWQLTINHGLAFGWPLSYWLTLLLTFLIIIFLLIFLINSYQKKKTFFVAIFSFLLIGAASNFWDRCWYGGVIDWIDISWFTVFNLADVYIVVAVIIWLLYEVLISKKKI